FPIAIGTGSSLDFVFLIMPSVYILFSPAADTYYIGATSDEVDIRLEKHLNKHYGSAFTSSRNDWQVFLQITCESMHHALLIERHIKKMKSRKYITNLSTYPEIVERLKEKYKA